MTTIVAIHLAAATAAIVLGAGILLIRRGTPRHRWMGRLWVSTMTATATTSFGIRELGHGQLSWLHALSVYVLVGLALAVLAIRRGDVMAHRRQMMGLFTGLIVAGVAAVAVPGRTLSIALGQLWQHEAPSIASPGGEGAKTWPKSRSGLLAMIAGSGWSAAEGAQQ
ncbi:hypothetical protein PAQ31011_04471 [Pandoraea aquatica]|uniref:DUF2306 domain-containing protein n=1 Tax=Pandoraea aquatica TaxID=2508290 RepID=A0A5E4YDI2_9BURK|nr:DUF2306 domain-containing protein [Pandoraea aquatica]VVE46799.1 hypothetical protein PAQ31011_04471 [Pandoraea aquatica]